MRNPYGSQVRANPTRDRRTIVFLLASLIFIGGAIFYSLSLSGDRQSRDDSPFTEENDWGGNLTERFGYEPIRLPADLEDQIHEDSEPGRVIKDRAPYDYLLEAVIDRPFRFFNHLGYTYVPGDVSLEQVLADPQANRARQFAVKGTLLSLDTEDLELPAPTDRVWRGTLRIDPAEGEEPEYAYFETPDEPGLEVGQIAQVFGIFFKSFDFPVMEGENLALRQGAFFIGKKVKRSYYYETVEELDMSIVRRARDDNPLQMYRIEEEVFYHIASYAKQLDPEEIREKYTEDADMVAVYSLPEGFRGQILKFRGKLIALEKVVLEDNPAALEAYYDGIIMTLDGVTVRVRFVNKPTGVSRSDLVSVRGVFMKKHKYDSRAETAPQVPFFVGITIDHVEFRDETLRHISVAVAIVAALLLVVFTLSLALGRRSARAFEEAYWKRRMERIRRQDPFASEEARDEPGGPASADRADPDDHRGDRP